MGEFDGVVLSAKFHHVATTFSACQIVDIRRIQFPRAHEDAKLLTLFTTNSSGRKLSHAMDIDIG